MSTVGKPPLEKTVVNKIRDALKTAGVKWIMKTHGGPYQQTGIPDLLCVAPKTGRLVGIEVKRPGGAYRATELQKKQIELIREAGGVAGVATGVDEALRLLEEAQCPIEPESTKVAGNGHENERKQL